MPRMKWIHAFCTLLLASSSTLVSAAEYQIPVNEGDLSFYASLLYLQPKSSNLKYAVFVSGNQPFSQSWHYQAVNPAYSPGFELGLNYRFPQSMYSASIDWLHLNTHDSSSKQASTNTDLTTVQFVAPAYDVGPAVFGIKKGASTAKFDFDSIELNVGKQFNFAPFFQAKLFGGINILRIHQTITTTFSDYAGTPPTTITYGLPPDPFFNFQTKNTSRYLGAGPDLGINAQFKSCYGFGVMGELVGTVTAGTIKVEDDFDSSSRLLILAGLNPSHQEITSPNMTQIVPGVHAKLGLTYNWLWRNTLDLSLEAGYRIAYYIDAISDVNPATLVQAGFSVLTPEFATGTMAIQSTDTRDRPFGYQGPYVTFTVNLL